MAKQPINVTGATLTVDRDTHAGTIITLNRAAGCTATLPAAIGKGDVYEFVIGTSVTTNAYIVKVANGTDTMCGNAVLFQDSGDTVVGFAAGSTADTINMDGSTQGGLKGAHITMKDVAVNLWHAEYISDASGTEATPFAATVS